MKHHKKGSKKQKLSLKYNVQKRVRESKRRIRKEAKKMGVNGQRKKKDPGIPNSWPFKAEMLHDLEQKQEKKEQAIVLSRARAKEKAAKDQKDAHSMKRQVQADRDAQRKEERAEAVAASQTESLRKVLSGADVILEVLDARDPIGCRCAALEAWAQEQGKRLIFVLAKADLVSPQSIVRWMKAIGHEGAVVPVAAEAGREGIPELLRMLGRPARGKGAAVVAPEVLSAVPEAQAVGVVGYASVGKKSLLKAMRQEAKVGAKWILEAVGHLKAASSDIADANAACLHMAVRGILPKGDAWQGATATKARDKASKDAVEKPGSPIATVSHLLERTPSTGLMRRFRMAAFTTVPELLANFAKDKNLKSKKGKPLAPEAVARRLLAELPSQPGCCCAPPEAAAAAGLTQVQLWAQHGGDDKAVALKSMMEAQAAVLLAREGGPSASALEISSKGVGAPTDIAGILAGTVTDVGDSDDDMEGSEGLLEEGEEEEFEGDESEDMSDEE